MLSKTPLPPFKSIDVAMFTLTHDVLVDAVLAQHHRGLRVRIIIDNRQAHCKGCDAQRLLEAGVDLRTDNSFYATHHKFAIIDECVVINGSFNWTAQAAAGNQEGVIIYRRASKLVAEFTAAFQRMWDTFGSSSNKDDGSDTALGRTGTVAVGSSRAALAR